MNKYLETTELEEAKKIFSEFIEANCHKLEKETVSIKDAKDRILCDAVYAKINAPHFYASAMDGIAMNSKDGFGATETTPKIITDYIVVDTGDPVPEEYDCVIMVEELINDGEDIKIISSPIPWQYIRQIGEDICMGEMVFPSFTKLNPTAIGSLASCGVLEVPVFKKIKVGIIPTGDEIVPITSMPKAGDIIEFNSLIYSGMAEDWGCNTKVYDIVVDDLEAIEKAIDKASKECDIVLIIAGSSKGRGDFTSTAIESIGTVLLHGVAIRPGKPIILGEVNSTIVIGTPGYPVSGVIGLNEFLKPAIDTLYKSSNNKRTTIMATLGKKIMSPLKYKEFIRCQICYKDEFVAIPLGAGASIISSFARADGIIKIDQNTEFIEAGQKVEVELLRNKETIMETVSIMGSHDPLFDELKDLCSKMADNLFISSAHVGSMGGIMAIKSGQTHMAGIHLLDGNDGSYNTSYIKKYFANKNVKLVKGVGRQQGIIVAKGNPKNIQSIKDLSNDIAYVNRQKGAGTRILFDYLLKKEGILPTDVYGYNREEPTHTAVAVQIHGGRGDCGMGIYSVAKTFDLDFIPICIENYDILVDEDFYSSDKFNQLIKILQSDEMGKRLEKLGGYTTDNIGELIDITQT